MYPLAICIQLFSIFYFTDAVTHLEIYPGVQCSYNYDLEVHTHRGERSTKELNFKINAKVSFVDFCWCDCIRYTVLITCHWHNCLFMSLPHSTFVTEDSGNSCCNAVAYIV